MNKFNRKGAKTAREVRSAKKAERRKQLGVSRAPNKKAVSGARTGKHQRRVEHKWRIAQKEALDSGLVTVQDIEMLVATPGSDGEANGGSKASIKGGAPPKAATRGFRVGRGPGRAVRIGRGRARGVRSVAGNTSEV